MYVKFHLSCHMYVCMYVCMYVMYHDVCHVSWCMSSIMYVMYHVCHDMYHDVCLVSCMSCIMYVMICAHRYQEKSHLPKPGDAVEGEPENGWCCSIFCFVGVLIMTPPAANHDFVGAIVRKDWNAEGGVLFSWFSSCTVLLFRLMFEVSMNNGADDFRLGVGVGVDVSKSFIFCWFCPILCILGCIARVEFFLSELISIIRYLITLTFGFYSHSRFKVLIFFSELGKN